MKNIKAFDEALEQNSTNGLNPTVIRAYRKAHSNENDLIDFEDFNNEDIEKITDCLKANGIEEITISSTWSGLLEALTAFEACGYRTNGMTQVNKPAFGWMSEGFEKAPAMKLRLA